MEVQLAKVVVVVSSILSIVQQIKNNTKTYRNTAVFPLRALTSRFSIS